MNLQCAATLFFTIFKRSKFYFQPSGVSQRGTTTRKFESLNRIFGEFSDSDKLNYAEIIQHINWKSRIVGNRPLNDRPLI